MDNIIDIAKKLYRTYGKIPKFRVADIHWSEKTYVIVEKVEFFAWSRYGNAYGRYSYSLGTRSKISCAGSFKWYLVDVLTDEECQSVIKTRYENSSGEYVYSVQEGFPDEVFTNTEEK